MCRAKVLPEENRPLGKFVELPNVYNSAAVSPTTLPLARITPDKIPGIATGRITLKIVLNFPAPRAKLASLNESFTDNNASSVERMINGKTIMVDVNTPAKTEY